MKVTHFLVATLLAGLCAESALAQEGKQEVSSASGRASSSASTEEDIGDIQPAPEGEGAPRFRASLQGGSQFVTNAKLQGEHSSGDVLWLPTAEVGHNIPIGTKFSLDFLGRSESVLYSDYVERSFFGFSGAMTFDYRYQQEYPRAYVALEPYWYQSIDTGDKMSSALGFVAGTDQGIPVGNGLTMLFWGARYVNYQASPDNDSRHQYRVLVGASHQFRPALYGQIYYTWQYSDYFNGGGRHDSRHAIGASLTYQFTQHLFGSVTAGFVDNDSNNVVADYQTATAGVALTWQF